MMTQNNTPPDENQTTIPDLPPPLPENPQVEDIKTYVKNLTEFITTAAKAIKGGAEIELEGFDVAIEQAVDAQSRLDAAGEEALQPFMDDMLDRLEYLADVLRDHAGDE